MRDLSIYLSALKYIDHLVGIDDLSGVCQPCGLSPNSRAHRIHDAGRETVIEKRNVPFPGMPGLLAAAERKMPDIEYFDDEYATVNTRKAPSTASSSVTRTQHVTLSIP